MKKKLFKALTVMLGAMMVLGSAAGCGDNMRGDNSGEEPVDETKTQLYVGFYYSGLGKEWIQQVADKFEERYAETEFETGKKGVQVRLDLDKAGLNGGDLLNTIASKRDQVFFVENSNMHSFISKGLIRDITDLVKSPALEEETVTIESKLDARSLDYYNVNGKYYAMPYTESFVGLNYNIDLFEEKMYYFAEGQCADDFDFENGDLNSLFIQSKDAPKSYGPDGKTGVIDGYDYSVDDGLPATYADFRALIMRISSYGDTPLIWCGNYLTYLIEFMNAVWADFEGYDQMMLNWTMDGTATNIVDVSNDGTITPFNGGAPVEINGDTGYLLQKQEGKYHALEFAKICVENNTNYYWESFSSSLKHTDAQRRFVKAGTGSYENIAMLIDGNWWDVEASSNYDEDPTSANSRVNANYGFMPIPKADSGYVGTTDRTLITLNNSQVFLNANTSDEMVYCAETFMKYVHSDEAMNIFSYNCNMMRPFDYELSEASLAKMNNYGKEMYRIHKEALKEDGVIKIQDTYPVTEEAIKNTDLLNPKTWGWTNVDGDANPFVTFKENANMTAAQYFNKLVDYYDGSWGALWK